MKDEAIRWAYDSADTCMKVTLYIPVELERELLLAAREHMIRRTQEVYVILARWYERRTGKRIPPSGMPPPFPSSP